jgi:hypothetical protein
MAINFPTSPSTNDTFTAGFITYKWDGAKWIGQGVTPETDRLVEGSNSLEINASNELVWTGGVIKISNSVDLTDSTVDLYSQTTNAASKTFQLFSDIGGTKTEKVYITANGAATLADEIKIQGASTPTGLSSRISKYGSLLIGTSSDAVGNARCSIDSGNGNIATVGSLAATSANLQSATTSSWFQTGTTLNSVGYVWAAKDSSANVWHSGLQTDGDLYLGGNLTSANNIGLKGSDGSAFFNGRTIIGTYSLASESLRVKGGEADIWLDSQTSGIWRLMGSTGGSTHMFRVYDNTNSGDRLLINASGRVRLPAVPGVAGSNLANLQIESDGNLCTTTSIRAAKTNISPLADTSWLFDLNPVTFNWRTKTENEDGTLTWGEEADDGTQYGLIAEEVEEVKDDFCYYNNDGELSGVHYDRLVAPLLKVVQQQKEEIEALKARLDAAGL